MSEIMDRLIDKLARTDDDIAGPGSRYIFKPLGYAEFLFGDERLIDYDYVRQQLKKRLPVELCVYYREEAEAELDDLGDDMSDSQIDVCIVVYHCGCCCCCCCCCYMV